MSSAGSFFRSGFAAHLRTFFFLTVLLVAGGYYSLKSSDAQAPSPIQQKQVLPPVEPSMPAPGALPGASIPVPAELPPLRSTGAAPMVIKPPGNDNITAPPVDSAPLTAAAPPDAIITAPPSPAPMAMPSAPVTMPPAPAPVLPPKEIAAEKIEAPRPPDEDKTEMLLEKIDVVEERLGELEKTIAALQRSLTEEKMAAEKKPEPPKSAATGAGVKKARADVARRKKAQASRSSAPRWVLKSAKPGMAWVVKAGSSELRTVSVGEELPGIGRITAVAKDSTGRWAVSGTKGRVSQ